MTRCTSFLVGTQGGTVLSMSNNMPAVVKLIAGSPTPTAGLDDVVPSPGTLESLRPLDARLLSVTGLVVLDGDNCMLMVGESKGIMVVTFPVPWSSQNQTQELFRMAPPDGQEEQVFNDIAVFGCPWSDVVDLVLCDRRSRALVLAQVGLPLRPGATYRITHAVELGGVPRQVAVWPAAAYYYPGTGHSPPRCRRWNLGRRPENAAPGWRPLGDEQSTNAIAFHAYVTAARREEIKSSTRLQRASRREFPRAR